MKTIICLLLFIPGICFGQAICQSPIDVREGQANIIELTGSRFDLVKKLIEEQKETGCFRDVKASPNKITVTFGHEDQIDGESRGKDVAKIGFNLLRILAVTTGALGNAGHAINIFGELNSQDQKPAGGVRKFTISFVLEEKEGQTIKFSEEIRVRHEAGTSSLATRLTADENALAELIRKGIRGFAGKVAERHALIATPPEGGVASIK